MALKDVSNYIKNLGKSVGYATIDALQETTPGMHSFVETNKDVFKDIYSSVRNFRSTQKKLESAVKGSKIYTAGEEAIKSVFEDIKTGEFYNKRRESEFEQKYSSLLSGFDEFDSSSIDFDDSDDSDITEKRSEKPISKDTAYAVSSIESSITASAELTSSTVAKTGAYVASVNKASTSMLMMQNERLFGGLNLHLGGVKSSIDNLYNIANNTLVTHAQNSKTYYEQTTNYMRENNALLKELVEMQRNIYKQAQEESKSKTTYSDITNANGMLDLKAYGSNILKNVKKMGGPYADMLLGGGNNDNMLAMLAASPLSFLPKAAVKAIIPATVAASAKELDNTISGLFGTILARFNNMKKSDNTFFKKIGEIFGVSVESKNKIDTSKYQKGAIPFDGITKKSIVEVIPGYLRRIEAILSGKTERIYDYESGSWTDRKKIKKDWESKNKRYVTDSTSDITKEISKYADNIGYSWDARQRINREIENFAKRLYDSGGYLPSNIKNAKKEDFGVTDDAAWKIIVNTLRRMPRSKLTNVAGNVMSARSSQAREIERYERNGSVFSALNDKSSPKEIYADYKNKDGKITGFDNIIGKSLIDVKDDTGHNIFFYLQHMYRSLEWFRYNYNGTGSYPYGTTAKSFDNIKIDSVFVDNRTKEEKDIQQKKKREREKYEETIAKLIKEGKIVDPSKYDSDTQNEMFFEANAHFNQYNKKNKKSSIEEERQAGYGRVYKNEKEFEDSIRNAKKYSIIDRLMKADSIVDKYNVLKDSVGELAKSPGKLLATVIHKADDSLYRFFFENKTGRKDEEGKEVRGFLNVMIYELNTRLNRMIENVNTRVLEPLKKKLGIDENDGLVKGLFKKAADFFGIDTKEIKEKLFGKDSIWGRFKQEMQDTLKKMADETKNALSETYGKAYKTVSNKLNPVNNVIDIKEPDDSVKIEYKHNSGIKRAVDKYIDYVKKSDKVEQFMSYFRKHGVSDLNDPSIYDNKYIQDMALRHVKREGQRNKENRNTKKNKKSSDTKNGGDDDGGGRSSLISDIIAEAHSLSDIETNARGARMITKSGITAISEGEAIIPANLNPWNPNRNSVDLNKQLANEKNIRSLFAKNMAGFLSENDIGLNAEGTTNVTIKGNNKNSPNSKDAEKAEKELENQQRRVMDVISEYAPTTAVHGIIGSGLGLLSGIVGGPLLGAAAGASIGILKKSGKLSNWLFGEQLTDENGNVTGERAGGVISKELQQALPDYKNFGIAGAITGLITPLGPIGGILAGSAIAYAKNNEKFQEIIFGEDGILSPERKEKLKKHLPRMGIGAAAGMLLGPFGLLGNAALGAGAGFLTSTDQFKDFLFGEEDKDGNRSGGILDSLRENFVEPLKEWGSGLKDRFDDFIKNNILNPIKDSLAPITKEATNIAKWTLMLVPNIMNKVFENAVGLPFGEFVKSKIISPASNIAKKLFNVATKPLQWAIKAPFKLLGGIGNNLRAKHIKKGNADYMSAEERLQWRSEHKIRTKFGDKFLQTDEALAGLNLSETEALSELVGNLSGGVKAADGEKRHIQKKLNGQLNKFFSSGVRKKIVKALNNNDAKTAIKLIKTSRGKNGNKLSNEDIEELSNLATDTINRLGDINVRRDTINEMINNKDSKINVLFEELGIKNFNKKDLTKLSKLLEKEAIWKANKEKNYEDGIDENKGIDDELRNTFKSLEENQITSAEFKQTMSDIITELKEMNNIVDPENYGKSTGKTKAMYDKGVQIDNLYEQSKRSLDDLSEHELKKYKESLSGFINIYGDKFKDKDGNIDYNKIYTMTAGSNRGINKLVKAKNKYGHSISNVEKFLSIAHDTTQYPQYQRLLDVLKYRDIIDSGDGKDLISDIDTITNLSENRFGQFLHTLESGVNVSDDKGNINADILASLRKDKNKYKYADHKKMGRSRVRNLGKHVLHGVMSGKNAINNKAVHNIVKDKAYYYKAFQDAGININPEMLDHLLSKNRYYLDKILESDNRNELLNKIFNKQKVSVVSKGEAIVPEEDLQKAIEENVETNAFGFFGRTLNFIKRVTGGAARIVNGLFHPIQTIKRFGQSKKEQLMEYAKEKAEQARQKFLFKTIYTIKESAVNMMGQLKENINNEDTLLGKIFGYGKTAIKIGGGIVAGGLLAYGVKEHIIPLFKEKVIPWISKTAVPWFKEKLIPAMQETPIGRAILSIPEKLTNLGSGFLDFMLSRGKFENNGLVPTLKDLIIDKLIPNTITGIEWVFREVFPVAATELFKALPPLSKALIDGMKSAISLLVYGKEADDTNTVPKNIEYNPSPYFENIFNNRESFETYSGHVTENVDKSSLQEMGLTPPETNHSNTNNNTLYTSNSNNENKYNIFTSILKYFGLISENNTDSNSTNSSGTDLNNTNSSGTDSNSTNSSGTDSNNNNNNITNTKNIDTTTIQNISKYNSQLYEEQSHITDSGAGITSKEIINEYERVLQLEAGATVWVAPGTSVLLKQDKDGTMYAYDTINKVWVEQTIIDVDRVGIKFIRKFIKEISIGRGLKVASATQTLGEFLLWVFSKITSKNKILWVISTGGKFSGALIKALGMVLESGVKLPSWLINHIKNMRAGIKSEINVKKVVSEFKNKAKSFDDSEDILDATKKKAKVKKDSLNNALEKAQKLNNDVKNVNSKKDVETDIDNSKKDIKGKKKTEIDESTKSKKKIKPNKKLEADIDLSKADVKGKSKVDVKGKKKSKIKLSIDKDPINKTASKFSNTLNTVITSILDTIDDSILANKLSKYTNKLRKKLPTIVDEAADGIVDRLSETMSRRAVESSLDAITDVGGKTIKVLGIIADLIISVYDIKTTDIYTMLDIIKDRSLVPQYNKYHCKFLSKYKNVIQFIYIIYYGIQEFVLSALSLEVNVFKKAKTLDIGSAFCIVPEEMLFTVLFKIFAALFLPKSTCDEIEQEREESQKYLDALQAAYDYDYDDIFSYNYALKRNKLYNLYDMIGSDQSAYTKIRDYRYDLTPYTIDNGKFLQYVKGRIIVEGDSLDKAKKSIQETKYSNSWIQGSIFSRGKNINYDPENEKSDLNNLKDLFEKNSIKTKDGYYKPNETFAGWIAYYNEMYNKNYPYRVFMPEKYQDFKIDGKDYEDEVDHIMRYRPDSNASTTSEYINYNERRKWDSMRGVGGTRLNTSQTAAYGTNKSAFSANKYANIVANKDNLDLVANTFKNGISEKDSAKITNALHGNFNISDKKYWKNDIPTATTGTLTNVINGMTTLAKIMNAPLGFITSLFSTIDKLEIPKTISTKAAITANKVQGYTSAIQNRTNTTVQSYAMGTNKRYNARYGMGHLSQRDPSISDIQFNAPGDTEYQTMYDSGCGPVAAATVLQETFGYGDPISAANYAISGGYKERNGGTYPSFFTNYLSDSGISSRQTTNKNEIKQSIASGRPTILMGQDRSNNYNTPYGSTPHYVVATGMDRSGNILVQNPESPTGNSVYRASSLLNKSSLGITTIPSGFGTRLIRKTKAKYGKGELKFTTTGKTFKIRSDRKMSDMMVQKIGSWEGLYLEAYICPAGIWTIGYGHTGSVDGKSIGSGMVISKQKAVSLLKEDIASFENSVNRWVSTTPITDHMFDALVSFAFNLGFGTLSDDFTDMLHNKDYLGIAETMLLYVNGRPGQELPGLVKRRNVEAQIFLSDDNDTSVYGLDGTEDDFSNYRDSSFSSSSSSSSSSNSTTTASDPLTEVFNKLYEASGMKRIASILLGNSGEVTQTYTDIQDGSYSNTTSGDIDVSDKLDFRNGSTPLGIEIAKKALSYRGKTAYVWGGKDADTGVADCSGFVKTVYQNAANINPGSGAMDQSHYGTRIDRNKIQPGDIVSFLKTYDTEYPNEATHVGISLGGDKYVDINERGGKEKDVGIGNLNTAYNQEHYQHARRINSLLRQSINKNTNIAAKGTNKLYDPQTGKLIGSRRSNLININKRKYNNIYNTQGRGTVITNASIDYNYLLEAIIEILSTIATNTAAIDKILTLLNNKYNIDTSSINSKTDNTESIKRKLQRALNNRNGSNTGMGYDYMNSNTQSLVDAMTEIARQ